MNKKIRKAIIPASDLEIRFLLATKVKIKKRLLIVVYGTIKYIIEKVIT